MTEPASPSPANGWAPGIIVLLVVVIGILAMGLYLHVESTSREHHDIATAFDRLGCVLAIQEFAERRAAVLEGDPCRYLREAIRRPR